MRKPIILFLIFIVLLTGCTNLKEVDQRVWYENKEEAITNGLARENASREDLLGIEEVQQETLVFFQKDLKLGAASISERNGRFRWYRTSPLSTIDAPGLPIASFGIDVTTENKRVFKIVGGIVYSSSVKQAALYYNGSLAETKPVQSAPSLFYFVNKNPGASFEVKGLE